MALNLKKIVGIAPSYQERYNATMHLAYHQAQLEALRSLPRLAIAPAWSEIVETYSEAIERLSATPRGKISYAETRGLARGDRERARVFLELKYCTRSAARSSKEAVRLPALTVAAILAAYRNVQRQEYAAESADLDSLLADLDAPKARAAVEAAGLSAIVESLREANEAFKTLQAKKLDRYRAHVAKGTLREARREADAALEYALEILRASAYLGGEEDHSAAVALLERVNATNQFFRAKFSRAKGGEKENGEATEMVNR